MSCPFVPPERRVPPNADWRYYVPVTHCVGPGLHLPDPVDPFPL